MKRIRKMVEIFIDSQKNPAIEVREVQLIRRVVDHIDMFKNFPTLTEEKTPTIPQQPS